MLIPQEMGDRSKGIFPRSTAFILALSIEVYYGRTSTLNLSGKMSVAHVCAEVAHPQLAQFFRPLGVSDFHHPPTYSDWPIPNCAACKLWVFSSVLSRPSPAIDRIITCLTRLLIGSSCLLSCFQFLLIFLIGSPFKLWQVPHFDGQISIDIWYLCFPWNIWWMTIAYTALAGHERHLEGGTLLLERAETFMRFYPVKTGISTSWRKENLRQETWHIVLKWTYLGASWWRFDQKKHDFHQRVGV